MIAFYLQHRGTTENTFKRKFFLGELKVFKFAGNKLDEKISVKLSYKIDDV